MRTWTAVFVCVAGVVVLVGGEASWDGALLAARIAFAALVVVALLAGVRAMTRLMTLPPYSVAARGGEPTRPPIDLTARDRGRAVGKPGKERSATTSPRTLRHAGQGEVR